MTVLPNDHRSPFLQFLEAIASNQIGDFFLSKVPWEFMKSILWLSP
ncbi:MAG TPA: hypothetical protein VE944_15505 [Nostoc sp.]|nr:hypothetical protein [Nostoc sp.]HYX15739.1 hypothetical protein [Nostoc sp.]